MIHIVYMGREWYIAYLFNVVGDFGLDTVIGNGVSQSDFWQSSYDQRPFISLYTFWICVALI